MSGTVHSESMTSKSSGELMSEHSRSNMDQKSGQEVAKVVPGEKKTKTLPKTDSRYWLARLFRNSYQNGGETALTRDWCARISRAGRRETFNLGSPNRDAAAHCSENFFNPAYRRLFLFWHQNHTQAEAARPDCDGSTFASGFGSWAGLHYAAAR